MCVFFVFVFFLFCLFVLFCFVLFCLVVWGNFCLDGWLVGWFVCLFVLFVCCFCLFRVFFGGEGSWEGLRAEGLYNVTLSCSMLFLLVGCLRSHLVVLDGWLTS